MWHALAFLSDFGLFGEFRTGTDSFEDLKVSSRQKNQWRNSKFQDRFNMTSRLSRLKLNSQKMPVQKKPDSGIALRSFFNSEFISSSTSYLLYSEKRHDGLWWRFTALKISLPAEIPHSQHSIGGNWRGWMNECAEEDAHYNNDSPKMKKWINQINHANCGDISSQRVGGWMRYSKAA